jgi:signal transduction histidine kinase
VEYVLLLYGAAFVGTGFALGVQARAASGDSLSRPALWAITAFALVHGAGEWVALAALLQQRQRGVFAQDLEIVRLGLLATSFALLGAFGLLLSSSRAGAGRWLVRALAAPAVLLAAWAVGAVVTVARGGAVGPAAAATAEAATRYALGIPATAVALFGLRRARRALGDEAWQVARLVGAASVAFAAYGFFTGAVVPASDLGPARLLNAQAFAATTHVPVELFRAAAIAAAGLLLSEVFVRTTTAHLRSEVEHLRDEFVALVAHDLRTPLGTVEVGAALLERLDPADRGSDRESRILGAIRRSVRAMSKMVNDLLDASRVQSRSLAVSPERLELRPLLSRLADWAPAATTRGHPVRLVAPDPLPAVMGDPVRVEQVLQNLLSNAGKYSRPGTEIVLEARIDPGEVTISVTNAGAGIRPEDLSRVFARNYRTRAARAGTAPGLGLGLYIARGLVESQGGRIWARSEVGRETTFAFTLRRAPAGPASATGEGGAPAGERAPGPLLRERGRRPPPPRRRRGPRAP